MPPNYTLCYVNFTWEKLGPDNPEPVKIYMKLHSLKLTNYMVLTNFRNLMKVYLSILFVLGL